MRWLIDDAGRDQPEGKLWLFEDGCVGDAGGVFVAERGFDRGVEKSGTDVFRVAARSHTDGTTRWTADLGAPTSTLTDVQVALGSDTLHVLIAPGGSGTTGPGRLLAFDRT